MIHFLNSLFKTSSPPPLKPAPQAFLTPLEIPEVLRLIFSYLDTRTIRSSIVLVCRQWYLLNQNGLIREVNWLHTWDSSRKDMAIRKLPGASRFSCFLTGVRTQEQDPGEYNICAVLKRLDIEYQKQMEQREMKISESDSDNVHHWYHHIFGPRPTLASSLYEFSPLRELNLFIEFLGPRSLDTFPFPSSLTKLAIQIQMLHPSRSTEIDLSRILRMCPSLESFVAETHIFLGLKLTWNNPFDSDAAGLQQQQQPLRLKSLVLWAVSFAQASLENLLPHTPDLKELKLKAMTWTTEANEANGTDNNNNNDGTKYNWTQLFQSLKTNNISLSKAHFSHLGLEMTINEIALAMFEVLPHSSSERILWAKETTPRVMEMIFYLSSATYNTHLTTLEVCWKQASCSSPVPGCYDDVRDVPQGIFELLCDAPELSQLTTLKTVVRLQDFDLFCRSGYTDLDTRQHATAEENSYDATPPPNPTVIWRCRGLRTLHIDLLAPNQLQFQHPVSSRLVFGYISRVCPVLQDLQICVLQTGYSAINPEFHFMDMRLGLSSGLSLLGRLQELRRLRVYSDSGRLADECQEWDLDWMVDSGRMNKKSKRERKKEVERWTVWRGNEDCVEADRLQDWQQQHQQGPQGNGGSSSNTSTNNTININTSLNNISSINRYKSRLEGDAEMLDRLKNLGLLLDVEEMLKEMEEEEGYKPMPALERLSFKLPIMLRPDEELQRMFPTTRNWKLLSLLKK